jgi:hypothetical protein
MPEYKQWDVITWHILWGICYISNMTQSKPDGTGGVWLNFSLITRWDRAVRA